MTLSSVIRRRLGSLRQALRSSPIYPLYRRLPERRQLADLGSLVDEIVRSPAGLDVADSIHLQIEQRRAQRRTLPASFRDATVVGFGASGWERYGLWPSFERECDFHFFSDGIKNDEPAYCMTTLGRRERAARLVEFVRQVDKQRQVHIVFIYADSSNLTPEALGDLAQMGCWTVLMGLDDRHTFKAFARGQLTVGVETVAPHCDLYWTSWRAGALLLSTRGSRAWFGGLGADPAFYHPVEVAQDIDVLFLGQAYGSRREVIRALQERGLKVDCRGFGWGGEFVSFDETIRLFSRAKIVLGISNVGAMSNVTIMKGRDFEVPMCGACYLTQYTEELGDFFDIGKDLLCYADPLQAAEIIATLLRDPARRERLRRNARESALARNTWARRLQEMFQVLAGQSGG